MSWLRNELAYNYKILKNAKKKKNNKKIKHYRFEILKKIGDPVLGVG